MPGHSNVTSLRRATSSYVQGLSIYLGALLILWRACSLHLLRQRKARRDVASRRTRRFRRRALMKLGGACACCGLPVDPFADVLTVHHINYNGKEHRQLLSLSSLSLNQWILTTDNPRAEPFPVEVLCQVCHQLTHQMGRCPHRWRASHTTPAAIHGYVGSSRAA